MKKGLKGRKAIMGPQSDIPAQHQRKIHGKRALEILTRVPLTCRINHHHVVVVVVGPVRGPFRPTETFNRLKVSEGRSIKGRMIAMVAEGIMQPKVCEIKIVQRMKGPEMKYAILCLETAFFGKAWGWCEQYRRVPADVLPPEPFWYSDKAVAERIAKEHQALNDARMESHARWLDQDTSVVPEPARAHHSTYTVLDEADVTRHLAMIADIKAKTDAC